MTALVRSLLVTVMIAVGAAVAPANAADPASPAIADSSFEIVQIWACEMRDGTTEVQVEGIAQDWLKAIRQLPGGAAVKMKVFFPTVTSNTDNTDFYFVMNAPTYTDWGKVWDAYSDDSAAAKAEDLSQNKVVCPRSMLWEAHDVVAN
jgi:hypothetical protein